MIIHITTMGFRGGDWCKKLDVKQSLARKSPIGVVGVHFHANCVEFFIIGCSFSDLLFISRTRIVAFWSHIVLHDTCKQD
jgi:hypothetical protein